MTSNSFSYSLRVWLTSVVGAPFLYLIAEIFRNRLNWQTPGVAIGSAFNIWLFYAAFELFFSLVTWLVFFLTIILIVRQIHGPFMRTAIICAAGVLFTIITFRVTLLQNGFFNDNNNYLGLMLCNCFCIGLGTWFYKLKTVWYMTPA